VSGEDRVSLTVPLDRFVDGGAVWADFCSGDSELRVSSGRWTVPHPPRPRRPPSVICTHNRPADCVKTLQTLAADLPALDALDTVYVVDQGDKRVSAHPDFEQVSAALAGRLRYITQANLGGAGGFTRGMYEITEVESEHHANVLFMDDDIILESESIIRMTAFANSAREPVIVGAQMLYALHPKRLHTGAEYADLVKLQAGKVVPGALWNADLTEENQEVRVDADYNAWWSALLPSEIVSATGYPLPVFFQWDDIEYGYRARENGFTTVTLPGAGVWHADFTWKDQDDWSRYFSIRNSLITSALHTGFDSRAIAVTLFGRLVAYIAGLQYGLAATVFKGIDDFLAGPESWPTADSGSSVRSGSSARPTRRPCGTTPPRSPASRCGARPSSGPCPTPRRSARCWPSAAVAADRAHRRLGGHHRGRRPVVARLPVPPGDRHRRLRRRACASRPRPRPGRRAAARERRGLLPAGRQGPAAAQQYASALPQLTSRENWRRLFGAGPSRRRHVDEQHHDGHRARHPSARAAPGPRLPLRLPRPRPRAGSSRELWLQLGWQDIRQRYRRSVLGPIWITISMAVTAVALGILYSRCSASSWRRCCRTSSSG
jgi:galactofuranosylgalactofuranosylrhamnosyl-N-acetylglucosaminyl-diphospho-decaprenol beta-1,5/1,6-galactofuranosyltransferase